MCFAYFFFMLVQSEIPSSATIFPELSHIFGTMFSSWIVWLALILCVAQVSVFELAWMTYKYE